MRWLAALCLVVSSTCDARPFTVDDLLRQESYGQVVLAKQAGLVLVERRSRYDGANDYSYGYLVRRLLSKILVTDFRSPARLQPLFDQAEGAGYWMGGLSPSGKRLAVFRLRDRRLSLGWIDLATRRARWFDVAPDLPLPAPAPIWLDENHLALSTIDNGSLPFILALGNANQVELTELWSRAAKGTVPSSTFVSTKAAEPNRATRTLVSIDVESGSRRSLFRGDILDVASSPDRGTLAIMTATAFRAPPATPIDTSFVGRRHALTFLQVSSGATRVATGDYLPGFLRWAPDGNALLTYRARSSFDDGELVSIAPTGAATLLGRGLTPETSSEQSGIVVQAGWAGSAVIAKMNNGSHSWMRIDGEPVALALNGSARLIGSGSDGLWFWSDKRLFHLDGRGRLSTVATHVIDVGTLPMDPYSLGYRQVFDAPAPSVIKVQERSNIQTRLLGCRRASDIAADPRSAVLATAGDVAVTLDEEPDGTETLTLYRGRKSAQLDIINGYLMGIDQPLAIPLASQQAPRGSTDWLFVPPGTKPAPLIVIPYPGARFGSDVPPVSKPGTWSIPANINLLNAAGYAVLLPSIPVPPPTAPSAGLTDAVNTAIARAIGTGRVDPARLGLLGHSFGAFAAMTIATESSRFKGVIASSGPYDLVGAHAMMTGSDRIRFVRGLPFDVSAGWVEDGQAHMGVLTGRTLSNYVAQSPISHAARVRTPVLLVHGDTDAAGVEQGEHMFMELARQGGDAALLRYWGEDHVLASPANIRDYWRQVIAFFDAHLDVKPTRPAPMLRSSPASSAPDSRG